MVCCVSRQFTVRISSITCRAAFMVFIIIHVNDQSLPLLCGSNVLSISRNMLFISAGKPADETLYPSSMCFIDSDLHFKLNMLQGWVLLNI